MLDTDLQKGNISLFGHPIRLVHLSFVQKQRHVVMMNFSYAAVSDPSLLW
jgi:hypothetical protein